MILVSKVITSKTHFSTIKFKLKTLVQLIFSTLWVTQPSFIFRELQRQFCQLDTTHFPLKNAPRTWSMTSEACWQQVLFKSPVATFYLHMRFFRKLKLFVKPVKWPPWNKLWSLLTDTCWLEYALSTILVQRLVLSQNSWPYL